MSSFEVTPFMHKPIYLPPTSRRDHEFPSLKASKRCRDLTLEEHLELVFVWDDKDEFINLAKDLSPEEDLVYCWFYPMYDFDAVNCVDALINPQTCSNFNFDIFHTTHGRMGYDDPFVDPIYTTPLHQAALFGSVNIIRLLLSTGESPFNISFDYACDRLKMEDALPLDIALQHPWKDTDMRRGTKNISIINLICYLCGRMKPRLETVRLLASKTDSLDLEFFKYMNDGHLPEMCMLLLAGCRPPSASMLRGRDIPEKEKVLELFHVFETIGDKLSGYVRMKRSHKLQLGRTTSDVYSLFQDSGLLVKAEDIPVCYPYYLGQGGFPKIPTSDSKKVSVPRLLSPHAVDGLCYTNKGSSLIQGVRSYHKSSVLVADRNRSSVPVKNKIIGDLNFQLYKHRAFFSTALRKSARLV